jgi:hypothetical protein
MQSYRAEGYGCMSLLLFLTHFIRYYKIRPADDLRVTSYCDNSSFLEDEEEFHNRDVDSSSCYLKPNHDGIMTLSEVREGLPFQHISRHVKSHQDEKRDYADLIRPEQLNVLVDHRATVALNALRAVGQTTEFYPLLACKPQSSTHYPPAEAILVRPPGISPVAKDARSEPNSLSRSFERTYKIATTGQTRPMTPLAGLSTDQPLLDSLTVSGHSWSNLVMAGNPSVFAKDDAALRLISARTATKSRLFPICTAVMPVVLGVSSSSLTSSGTLKRPTLQPTYAV